VTPTFVASGVHIDGDQSFSLVDHNIAAALEPDLPMKCVINLLLHTVSLKNRGSTIGVANTVSRAPGDLTNHVGHSIGCPAIVAKDFIDFFGKKIADGALDQIGFFKQAARRRVVPNGLINFGPLIQQNSQIANKIPSTLTFA